MPAWLALVLLGALTIGYCVAWVIVDRFILSYRPLGPDREWIKGCQRRLKTDPFSSAKVDPLGLCA